ncbi:MAG: fasciclin domain-containing protein [Myxococcota bacterium]
MSLPLAIACGDDDGGSSTTDDMGMTDVDMGMTDDDMGMTDDDMGMENTCGQTINDPPCFLEQLAAEDDTQTLAAVINAILLCVDGAAGNLAGLDLLAPTRTIFAPNNDAVGAAATALGVDFATIAGKIEADATCGTLTEEETGQLNTLFGIIAYHIIDGQFSAADLASNEDGFVRTVIGQLEGGDGVKAYLNEAGDGIRYVDTSNAETEAGVDRADVAVTIGAGDPATTIHVIDAVLLPPSIPAVAILEGLTGLVGAVLGAAPIGETPVIAALANPAAELTVFAPDNAAFGMLEALPDPEPLRDILLFHVVDDYVLSGDLPETATTLATLDLTFDASGDPVTINGGSGADGGADIIAVDIQASNGVVHLINRVLLPPAGE